METGYIAAVWQDIRRYLEDRKAELSQEIRNYPPPIPACDVQFNTLMEQRTGISRELGRMDTLSHNPLSTSLIDNFVSASISLDDDAKQRIRLRLHEAAFVEE